MKYPIGIQTFERIIAEGCVYVDKTDMVYSLANEGFIYFLSRPRRFGKSLLVSTLENYFLGRKELFKGLKIDSLEKDWKTYPVFHLDFSGQNFTNSTELTKKLNKFITDYEAIYGIDERDLTLGDRFAQLLETAHKQTGLACVVLIDEYDKPLLDVMDLPDTVERNNTLISLEDYNREILKGLYSTFKAADTHLQFVFLTGVTKFSQLSVFSGFNHPEDISMAPQFATICGITEEEVDTYFREPIEQIAKQKNITYDSAREMLRKQYDGYHFCEHAPGVYNPFSLLNALKRGRVSDFWFESGTPTYLYRLLEKSNENLDQIAGKYFTKDDFENYQADSQQPLPMIYQSGYLTIKDYDDDADNYLLDFPNDEVKKGFATLVANSFMKTETAGSWVSRLIKALRVSDLEAFRKEFTSFLASIPYNVKLKKEQERFFTYTLYLIFRIASCYVTYAEKEQSQGRLDCAIETPDYVYIFEFKLDGTAAEALKQINDKGYATEYLASGKKIYKVGISIASETGTVGDWGVEE